LIRSPRYTGVCASALVAGSLFSCASTSDLSMLNPVIKSAENPETFDRVAGSGDSAKSPSKVFCTHPAAVWRQTRDQLLQRFPFDTLTGLGVVVLGNRNRNGNYCDEYRYKFANLDSIKTLPDAFSLRRLPDTRLTIGIDDRFGLVSGSSDIYKGWTQKPSGLNWIAAGAIASISQDRLVVEQGLDFFAIAYGTNSGTKFLLDGAVASMGLGYALFHQRGYLDAEDVLAIVGVNYSALETDNSAFGAIDKSSSRELGGYFKLAYRLTSGPTNFSFFLRAEEYGMNAGGHDLSSMTYGFGLTLDYVVPFR
jgi:hypothetical protein